jgi:UDP-glucuronate 4-epimerase
MTSSRSVLVTGCAGFIGSHLTEMLLDEGWRVYGIDKLDDYYPAWLKIQNLQPSLRHPRFSLDILDLAQAVRVQTYAAKVKPDVVVHLAAVAGVRLSLTDPGRYVRANVVATQNVLDAWSRGPEIPLVFGSSSSVYGDDTVPPFTEDAPCTKPRSPYAATKRCAELLCEVAHSIHGCPITVLRFFTVYGPRQRPDLAIRAFTTAVLRDQEITVFGDGSMARDFTHVSDIVRGIRAAMEERGGLRTVNLGNSSPCSVLELVAKIGQHTGKRPRVRHVDRPPGEMNITYADTRRAAQCWGWEAKVELDRGLSEFTDWLTREEAEGRNP